MVYIVDSQETALAYISWPNSLAKFLDFSVKMINRNSLEEEGQKIKVKNTAKKYLLKGNQTARFVNSFGQKLLLSAISFSVLFSFILLHFACYFCFYYYFLFVYCLLLFFWPFLLFFFNLFLPFILLLFFAHFGIFWLFFKPFYWFCFFPAFFLSFQLFYFP